MPTYLLTNDCLPNFYISNSACVCREQKAVKEGLAKAMVMARNASMISPAESVTVSPTLFDTPTIIEKASFEKKYAKTVAALARFGVGVENANASASAGKVRLSREFDEYRRSADHFRSAMSTEPDAYFTPCPLQAIERLFRDIDDLNERLRLNRPSLFLKDFCYLLTGKEMQRRDLHIAFAKMTDWLVKTYYDQLDEHKSRCWDTGISRVFQAIRKYNLVSGKYPYGHAVSIAVYNAAGEANRMRARAHQSPDSTVAEHGAISTAAAKSFFKSLIKYAESCPCGRNSHVHADRNTYDIAHDRYPSFYETPRATAGTGFAVS